MASIQAGRTPMLNGGVLWRMQREFVLYTLLFSMVYSRRSVTRRYTFGTQWWGPAVDPLMLRLLTLASSASAYVRLTDQLIGLMQSSGTLGQLECFPTHGI